MQYGCQTGYRRLPPPPTGSLDLNPPRVTLDVSDVHDKPGFSLNLRVSLDYLLAPRHASSEPEPERGSVRTGDNANRGPKPCHAVVSAFPTKRRRTSDPGPHQRCRYMPGPRRHQHGRPPRSCSGFQARFARSTVCRQTRHPGDKMPTVSAGTGMPFSPFVLALAGP